MPLSRRSGSSHRVGNCPCRSWGLSLAEAFIVLAGPHAPVDGLVDAYKEAFGVLRTDPALAEPLFPGAEECLSDLQCREDVLLGIATGKTMRGVSHFLD